MLAVAEEVLCASRAREKKRKNVLVCLLDVACRTRQYKVVAPIVRAFSFARRNVIECDPFLTDTASAISARWPMTVEQPTSRVGVRIPARRQRSVLLRRPAGSFLFSRTFVRHLL